jgi:phage-related protein (TIGR01555 family)
MAWTAQVTDTLINFLSKLGTKADKSTAARYAMLGQLDQAQLEAAYRTDWIARKIVDIPPNDCTREWRQWQTDADDVTLIEDVEKVFKVQQKVKEAQVKARLFGGAAIIIGTDDGDMSKPLDVEKVKKDSLKFVHVVTRWEIQTGPIIQDLLDPDFGKPEYFSRTPFGEANEIRIHPSRVCVFKGAELPTTALQTAQADMAWGDSTLQIVDDAVKAAGLVLQSGAVMVQEANFDIIRIPGFTAQIATAEYEQRMLKRMAFSNTAKSVVNGLLMDKEDEWQRVNANMTALPDMLRMYLIVVCGAADIPATRFLSQSPTGMNATGDSDTRNYYDRCSSDQKNTVQPTINPLDECIIRSALGTKPDKIWYEWRPLWQPDQQARSTTEKQHADAWKIDVDSGLFNPDLLREARASQLAESGVYPGWDDLVEEFGTEPPEPTPEELAAQAAMLGGVPPAANSNAPPAVGKTLPPNNPNAKAVPAKGAPPAAARPRKAVGDALFEENRRRAMDAMRSMHHPGYAVGRVPKFAKGAGKWVSTGRGLLGLEMSPHETDEDVKAYRLHAKDMAPLPLYVRRDVRNAEAILAHYKKQLPDHEWFPASELHVTIIYCLNPVDWLKAGNDGWNGDDKGNLSVPPGGPRVHEAFGGDTLVLSFAAPSLTWRHEDIKWRTEAETSYPNYQPHMSLALVGTLSAAEMQDLEPWLGPIELGVEIFEQANAAYATAAE